MDTTSNAVGGIRETAIRKKKKKKDRWRKKESTGEVPCGQTMWSYPAENFRDSQLRTYTEGTSSFVPSAGGTARASRSAICQTRLKICAVGSSVIIAEAYE